MLTISFVIPTYNRKDALLECLRAVERESRAVSDVASVEVVVVDDGSTDGSLDAVRHLQKSLSIAVEALTQSNQGPGAARNRGVSRATGDLVVFLGDDIILQEGHLRSMLNCYREHADSGRPVGIVGLTSYSPDSIPTPFGQWLEHDSDLQFAYNKAVIGVPLGYGYFYTSNILVPRQLLLESGGFNTEFRSAAFEDIELGFRLEAKGLELYYCPDARAVHIHHVSFSQTAARMRMIARAALELRSANPDLYLALNPEGDRYLERVSPVQRLARWFFSHPLATLLAVVDQRLRLKLPGALYQRVMLSIQLSEMARLWSLQRGGALHDVGEFHSGEKTARRVSILIVNWNGRERLLECLRTIVETVDLDRDEVIVVDNASVDGSCEAVRELYPQVHIVCNSENRGYAHANNQAYALSSGEYVFLLNPDAQLTRGAVDELLDALNRLPGAGATTANLVSDDNEQANYIRRFPTLANTLLYYTFLRRFFPGIARRVIERYLMSGADLSRTRRVPQAPGACLLLRRSALITGGALMDERFPLFYNDVDLCRSLWDRGYSIYFVPSAVIRHTPNRGGLSRAGNMLQIEHAVSLSRYFRKHRPYWEYAVIRLVLLLHFSLLFAASLVLRGRWKPGTSLFSQSPAEGLRLLMRLVQDRSYFEGGSPTWE
ncbi:MAG: glycosyltransferase family 2 protein [Chloroflexota bacterium]|nr:glycosyltransferase family 2 protein [Chloroflexota bacterium]